MGTYDLGIIGSGPGGIACAIQAQTHGLSFFIIEKGSRIFQGIIDSYPKGKKVYATIPRSETGPFPIEALAPAPDKPPVEEYVDAIEAVVAKCGIAVQFNEDFESLSKERDAFVVVTGKGHYRARAVVLAFGSNIPVDLGVYGEAKTIARTLDNPRTISDFPRWSSGAAMPRPMSSRLFPGPNGMPTMRRRFTGATGWSISKSIRT